MSEKTPTTWELPLAYLDEEFAVFECLDSTRWRMPRDQWLHMDRPTRLYITPALTAPWAQT